MAGRFAITISTLAAILLVVGLFVGFARAPDTIIPMHELAEQNGLCSTPVTSSDLRPQSPYRMIRLAIFDYNFLPHPKTRIKKPKAPETVRSSVQRREKLEQHWLSLFRQCNFEPTPRSSWVFPVHDRRAELKDNYRPGTHAHEAVDIFAPHGSPIRAAVTGYVVEAGDNWSGRYEGGQLIYRKGGLTPKAGNGILLFDPASEGYFWYSHLRDDLRVETGDFVQAGAIIGYMGNTGNARRDGHGRHLHLAYKVPGSKAGINGVLVGHNPYPYLHQAFRKMKRNLHHEG